MLAKFKRISYLGLIKQLLRFGMTGCMAAMVQYLTVILIVETLHINPLWANVIGFACGFIVSFFGHRFWTFRGCDRKIIVGLPMFLVVAGINFIINQSLFYIFLQPLKLHYASALFISLCFMAATTFLLSKLWVFRHRT